MSPKNKLLLRLSSVTFAAACVLPATAFAADEGMIVFRDGFSVRFDDGFRQISAALKNTDSSGRAVEVTSGSQTFVVNLNEIALICRDRCANLKFEGLAGRGITSTSDSNRASVAIEQNRIVVPAPREKLPTPTP